MRWPSITIHAAVFTAAIGIDGAVEGIIILPTNLMRKKVKQLINDGIAKYPVKGGDDDASEGALVPIKELMNYET